VRRSPTSTSRETPRSPEEAERGRTMIRHGWRHDWYQNPKTRISQPVPRHAEINENLARHILKLLVE
jgi:hypothetical protein